MDELLVEIEGYPNYVVSNYGRVINIKRDKDLKLTRGNDGYLRVALYHNNIRQDFYVHRLVAEAFFLMYREGIKVDFIDGDKENCSVLNLSISNQVVRGRVK